MTAMPFVQGRCPMGCGGTLFVGEGGHVTCSYAHCPDPGAADDLLANAGAVRCAAAQLVEQLSDAWWFKAAQNLDLLRQVFVEGREPVRNRTSSKTESCG